MVFTDTGMYPHGFVPTKTAIFANFKSYKNRLDGIFFRNVFNSRVEGGVFADNRYQADFDRSDSIVMNGTRLIGSTARYREILSTQEVWVDQDRIVGLELHPSAPNPSNKGLTVQNIVFEGFHLTNISEHSALVELDQETDDPWSGNFDYWTTFEDITIKNNDFPFHFDFVQALNNANNSYKSIYVVDLDSSMKPPSINATGTSTIIADSDEMKAFIDLDRCTSIEDRGYLYCQETCLRSVTFAVDPSLAEDFQLRVQAGATQKEYHFEGSIDVLTHDDFDRHERAMTDVNVLRYFIAPLPPGQYKAMFVNKFTGESHWPTFVETRLNPALCSDTFNASDIELEIPPPNDSMCHELIQNGDMEQSKETVPRWLQDNSVLQIANGRGRMGSTAVAEVDLDSPYGALGQYIDVRCLTEGETYLVQAWAYLDHNEADLSCEHGGPGCPRLLLRMTTQEDQSGDSHSKFTLLVARSFAKQFVAKGWNLLQGIVTISAPMARATKALVFVDRRFSGRSLLLDDVSMTHIEKDCSELVFNGNMSKDTTLFWDHEHGVLDLVQENGTTALQHSGRQNSGSAITQRILTGCMKKGVQFVAKAKVKVLIPDGNVAQCNQAKVFGEGACPRLRLRAFSDYTYTRQALYPHPGSYIARTDYGVTNDGWMTISGVFTATREDELAEQSVLVIDGPGPNMTVVVNEVSISPLEKNCQQLVLNGDAELGETAQFWWLQSKSNMTSINVITEDTSGDHAFLLTGRKNSYDGMVQRIDSSCLTLGSKWKVKAQMKFRSHSVGSFVACIPKSTCPSVHLLAVNGRNRINERFPTMLNNKNSTWLANEFNDVESVVVITDALLANGGQVFFGFRRFDKDWDLFIDNISVTPLAE